ncbi:thiamine-binding protein [Enemella sp. A6]|uniref:thiamine-binding protein n=1 Tax=Enemella sp. A6 TaxID=3440152 RepID=UPI003EBAC849
MLIHVHVGPSPLGDERGTYAHVEAAIRVIEASGLEYQVEALGTTIQGPAEKCWPLLQELHEACLESGAKTVMTHVRILQSHDDTIEASMGEIAARITH